MFFIGELCPIEPGRSYKPSPINGYILFLRAFVATQFCSRSIEIRLNHLKDLRTDCVSSSFYLFLFGDGSILQKESVTETHIVVLFSLINSRANISYGHMEQKK